MNKREKKEKMTKTSEKNNETLWKREKKTRKHDEK